MVRYIVLNQENTRKTFAVADARGATVFTISRFNRNNGWIPLDLGYHSRTENYDWLEPIEECEVLGGSKCWSDGSGIQAERVGSQLPDMRWEDSPPELLWELLESRHSTNFTPSA